jgi:hypothetical protein
MPEERLPPNVSHRRKLCHIHIDLLVEWRRTFRTIASGRGKRTRGSSRSIDRSNHHDEESSTMCTSVFLLPSPTDESYAILTLICSSNSAALFGRSHQGDERNWASSGSIDRSIYQSHPADDEKMVHRTTTVAVMTTTTKMPRPR